MKFTFEGMKEFVAAGKKLLSAAVRKCQAEREVNFVKSVSFWGKEERKKSLSIIG